MTTPAARVVALAALVLMGCEKAPVPVDATAPGVPSPALAKAPKSTSFLFSKIPAAVATQSIASPTTGMSTIVFQMNAAQAAGIVVKQFGFMISGSLQAGDVGNYQLLYYPQGLGKPSVIMGGNNGSTWVAPGGFTFIYIDLASPITIPKGNTFTAVFELRADVSGTGSFFFYPRVQTCLVNAGTGDKDVAWFGGDLPLQGDTYRVN